MKFNNIVKSKGSVINLVTTDDHPELKPSLKITRGATVHFVNLSCCSQDQGAAVNGHRNGVISIGIQARVVFMHNHALSGAAITLGNRGIVVTVA